MVNFLIHVTSLIPNSMKLLGKRIKLTKIILLFLKRKLLKSSASKDKFPRHPTTKSLCLVVAPLLNLLEVIEEKKVLKRLQEMKNGSLRLKMKLKRPTNDTPFIKIKYLNQFAFCFIRYLFFIYYDPIFKAFLFHLYFYLILTDIFLQSFNDILWKDIWLVIVSV